MLEREIVLDRYHAHGLFLSKLHAEIFQLIFHGVDAASLPHDDLHGRLPDDVPVEWEKLGSVFISAVLIPAGNDAGFDLKQSVADNLPVAGDRVTRKLLHEFRKAIELVILESGVDSIEGKKRERGI